MMQKSEEQQSGLEFKYRKASGVQKFQKGEEEKQTDSK